ncbi:MAG: DUF2865 domain-containing protein [Hyphomicrobiaceae bacterium]
MRQLLIVCALAVSGLAASIAAGGDAMAQSFFEKLFGLGDSLPRQPTVKLAPRVNWQKPAIERDVIDRREQRPLSGIAVDSGDVVQTMCVRTCDGYYWPVRYPATAADFGKDANVCASTCGAEAKLFTRSGPGAEPEEMKDAQGISYGTTKTAFAYRKGLVKGCSCRSMPWSEAERARHEGYALADAERALRVANAEAEREAAIAAAAEKAATSKKHAQLVAAIEEAEAKREQRGFKPGPAEAAAIAAFAAVEGGAMQVVEVAPKAKRLAAKERRRTRKVRVEPVHVQRVRLPRGYAAAGVRIVAPKYAATASKAWWQ